LLDLGLPDGDGLDVLNESQRLDPSLPVVIVTAHISSDRTVGSLTAGAYAYLTKPYDREELRHTLRRAIGVKELTVKVERTEHLLNQSEDRFRSLVNSATDAIVLADHRGRIVSWNRSASRLFGYDDEEAIGQPLTLLMPARYHHAHVQGLTRMESTGKSHAMGSVIEVHGLRKDGTEFPIELSLATWKSMDHSYYSGIIRDISDRKKSERAVQESQERFRQLAKHISEVFWMTDTAKQQMLYVSSGYEAIWGRSCESLYASPQSWLDAVHPEDRARVLDAALHKQVAGTYDEQYRILRPDGAIRWISDRAFPIRDSSGIVYRIVGLAGDMTDQMRIQQLLRASEERLELVIQGSHDGFWDGLVLPNEPWSSPHTPVWWSPRAKAILGYTDEEFPDVLESWASRLHPEDAGRVFAALTAHIERHDPYDVEYRLLTKAGTYSWLQARGQAIWDETGKMTRMAGSLRDVTDRKQAEDALRRTEQLLEDVVNNTTAVIYVKYADGRYLLINRRFEQLFHITMEQIAGRTDHEIFPKDIADAFRANDVLVLERNHTMEYEEHAPHSDGLHTYISIKFPLCDQTGKPYAICGISTDITERKQVETALRASQEHLRQALQASNTGLWDWNTETNDVWLSREWKHQLGYEEADLRDVFESWETHLHPDDHDQAIAFVWAYLAHPVGDYQQEFRLRHKDGTYRWIEARASFVIEPDGRRVRLLGSHTDITERKSIERNLRSLTEQLHLALTATEIGTWNWDLQTDRIYWSSQVDKILGPSGVTCPLTKYDWLALVYREDRESMTQAMRQAKDQDGAGVAFKHRVLLSDGNFQWFTWEGEIIRDQDGKAVHILGTVRATGGGA
jgi:PAS domain S-box-containing protein